MPVARDGSRVAGGAVVRALARTAPIGVIGAIADRPGIARLEHDVWVAAVMAAAAAARSARRRARGAPAVRAAAPILSGRGRAPPACATTPVRVRRAVAPAVRAAAPVGAGARAPAVRATAPVRRRAARWGAAWSCDPAIPCRAGAVCSSAVAGQARGACRLATRRAHASAVVDRQRRSALLRTRALHDRRRRPTELVERLARPPVDQCLAVLQLAVRRRDVVGLQLHRRRPFGVVRRLPLSVIHVDAEPPVGFGVIQVLTEVCRRILPESDRSRGERREAAKCCNELFHGLVPSMVKKRWLSPHAIPLLPVPRKKRACVRASGENGRSRIRGAKRCCDGPRKVWHIIIYLLFVKLRE